jgi:hypothetical protein
VDFSVTYPEVISDGLGVSEEIICFIVFNYILLCCCHFLLISFFLFFRQFPSFCFFSYLFSSFFLTEFNYPKNSGQVLLGVAPICLTIHCCTEYSSLARSLKIWISLLLGAKEYFIPPLLIALAHILQRYILNFRKKSKKKTPLKMWDYVE